MSTNLQNIRKRAGLNQSQVAKELEVDASLLSRWERGEREPSFEQQIRLARIFGVTVDYLLNGKQKGQAFKFRATKNLTSEEERAINQALLDAEQQLFFLDEAWRLAEKSPKPFPFNINIGGLNYYEAAADAVRETLRLNERVTYDELREALVERGVQVFSWYLPPKLSGMSFRETFAAIFINESHPIERRLFTLAHEATHVLCHLTGNGNIGTEAGLVSLIGSNRDPEEKEANRLAAELLMPTKQLKEIVSRYGDSLKQTSLLDMVARSFNVSREAMFYRLAGDDFSVFEWTAKKRYFTPQSAEEKKYSARVTNIGSQVSPDFLVTAIHLYQAEKISAGKLSEWFGSTQQTTDVFLHQLDQRIEESGFLTDMA